MLPECIPKDLGYEMSWLWEEGEEGPVGPYANVGAWSNGGLRFVPICNLVLGGARVPVG